MRWLAVSVLALSACGGSTVEWVGNWLQPAGIPPGSYIEATLGGSGHTISGTGVQHREAGASLTFTAQGTTQAPASLTLTYQDSTTESFAFAQPDADHITLTNAQRTVNLVRQ